jgi:hypothetical protein
VFARFVETEHRGHAQHGGGEDGDALLPAAGEHEDGQLREGHDEEDVPRPLAPVLVLTTASTTPGMRSIGPWASVPDFTARTAATVPTRRRDAAAGEAKDTRPVSESQRKTAPAMRSAIAKWTTIGWRPAMLGIA